MDRKDGLDGAKNMRDDRVRFETMVIHAGQQPDPAYGAIVPPIYQTSTFAFEDAGRQGRFDYSRNGNPTRQILEECMAALEQGTRGFAFATGMAAQATALMMFEAGDHLLVHDDLYGGTYRLIANVLANKRIEPEFINMCDLDRLRSAVRPNTRGIWTETPTNPLMNLLDLEAIAEIARTRNVLTFCDNTFLTPYFQRPLALGIDVVVHSTTKYINGHSDVVGGAAVVRDPQLADKIAYLQTAMGTCSSPMDCFLVLRGIKTLAVRMEAHNRNALGLARWLQNRPEVSEVLHPGLPSHPQHSLALRQATGFGGTFSFRLAGGQDAAFDLMRRLRLFTMAESLGGVESLIEHPATMSHLSMPEEVRRSVGITEDLVRVSVGIEHPEDLIEDMDRALSKD